MSLQLDHLYCSPRSLLIQADQKSIRFLIIVVAVLHAVMALLFKVMFFSYYIDGNIGPGDPTGINPR